MTARRDALAAPYVHQRLEALKDALSRDPLSIAAANKALKEAVNHNQLVGGACMNGVGSCIGAMIGEVTR